MASQPSKMELWRTARRSPFLRQLTSAPVKATILLFLSFAVLPGVRPTWGSRSASMSSMASSIRSQCARQRDGNRLCHGSRGPRPAFALPPPMLTLSSLFELIPRNQRTTKASKPFMTTSSLRSEKSSLLRPDGPLLSFLSTGRTLLFSSTLGSTLVGIQQ